MYKYTCNALGTLVLTEKQCFFSAAALLAMQSAVIPTAILSVCPSHAGTLSRRMKGGSCSLHYEVAKTL